MSRYSVSTRLTSHLKTASEKKEFAARIIENSDILARFVDIIEAEKRKSRNFQIDRESFRNPEWANQVAFEFGYQKALDDIINLLTIKAKDE